MRRMTLLWLSLAAICSAVLFHTSQQVTDGRARLAGLQQDIRREDETVRVLQAEWSYLNQPDRLEKLSKEYLELAPLKGRQFTQLDGVEDRPVPVAEAESIPLPGAGAAVKASAPADETPIDVTAAVGKAAAGKPPEKAADAKTPAEKPGPEKPAVVRIRKPTAPPAVKKQPAPLTAGGAPRRSFGDVMRSLGVH